MISQHIPPSLLLIILFPLSIYFLLKRNKHHDDIKPYPILGHLPQFIKNREQFHDWITQLLISAPTNTLVFHRPGNTNGVITANPANVEHILKTNFESFPKGPKVRAMLHDFLGDGIFNSDGHQWKVQRKTASFEFNTKSLRHFVVETVNQETTTRLIPFLKNYAESKQAFDLQDVLERYAFDNVCKVAFNVDPVCLTNETPTSNFADAFRDAAEYTAGRFRYAIPGFWKIKRFLNIGSERILQESSAIVHDFATQIIRSRMKERKLSSVSQADDDLLSRFITLEDYSEESLRDIVISFLLAGRETTSSALSWFFWILSSRTDVQNKILKEIESIRSKNVNKKHTFEFDELREMQYLHAAITESMRLYPPVPTNMSVCAEDTILPDGTKMKKGQFMSYHSYAMGRMEKVWGKDCMDYKPERWLDENGMFRPESPFKFLAFHAGPRLCLGKEMAYIQMKSIVACVLEKFVVEMVEKKCPKKMLSLTLRMQGGLPVYVKYRHEMNCH